MRAKLRKLIQKPELIFLILAATFGLLSAVMLPVLQAPDETSHFTIEYAVFSPHGVPYGATISKDVSVGNSGPLVALQHHDYRNYYTARVPSRYGGFTVNIDGQVAGRKSVKASVFDIMHLPQALGVLVGRLIYPSIGVEVLMGRLFSLALYIGVLYFVIKNIRYGKWVLAFVACLPMMIQQAASVSYDGINLLAIFVWFALMINLFTKKTKLSRKQLILGVLSALFLLLTKANNILLLILLFALPARYITETKVYQKLRSNLNWRTIKFILIVGFILVICGGTYVMFKHLLAGQSFHSHRLFDVLMNSFVLGDRGNLTLIDTTVTGMIGEFGIFYYHLPVWTVVIAFTTLVILMLHEKLPQVSKRFAVISGALFFGSILIISIGMYYDWAITPWRLGPGAQVADGIQGRYFTPLLVLLFPTFAYAQKYVKVSAEKEYAVPVITTSTLLFLLLFYIGQTWFFFWHWH